MIFDGVVVEREMRGKVHVALLPDPRLKHTPTLAMDPAGVPVPRVGERCRVDADTDEQGRWESARLVPECDAVSAEGTKCAREAGHAGCHERYVDGDGRRWWDDAPRDPEVERLREGLSLARAWSNETRVRRFIDTVLSGEWDPSE